jgi:hypothetical protein
LLRNIEIIESVEVKPSDPLSPKGFADLDTTAEREARIGIGDASPIRSGDQAVCPGSSFDDVLTRR